MICARLDVEIVKGNISRDHVHLLVSVPPTLAVSWLVQRLKGARNSGPFTRPEHRGVLHATLRAPS
jgi:REP element-mobilizing transposase RayT